MRHVLWFASVVWLLLPQMASAQKVEPKVIASGLERLASIAVAPDGKTYVTVRTNEFEKKNGAVMLLDNGKLVPFCSNVNNPSGIVAFQKWLFVADQEVTDPILTCRILKIDSKGKPQVLAKSGAFTPLRTGVCEITVDPENGTVYVLNSGYQFLIEGKKLSFPGTIFKIDPKGKIAEVTNKERWPEIKQLSGLVLDGASHLLTTEGTTGVLYRVNIASGKAEKVTGDFGAGGLAWDHRGQLFGCDFKKGLVLGIPRPGEKPVQLPYKLEGPTSVCLDSTGKSLLVVDNKAGKILSIPAVIPGWEVDTSPLPLETALAWPKMKWPGWEPMTPAGKPNDFRPLMLTHAGDGTNRNFVATQQGVIYVFPNDPDADKSRTFLDISDRVFYAPNENEQGLLGMAFHPDYKKNGEFFVFYTPKKNKKINFLSRFTVRKDDPSRAEAVSEEVLLEIKRPFWNHDGGTIVFGPDGFLYVALGDGGDANDPFNNAQDLKQLLGHILRIDVNNQDPGKKYAIPKDNPFVGREGVLPEIYAYGLRNVWRMAFDKKTGQLWAADVGQNLYEEINLIVKGGNYGWKLREGLHPFWSTGSGPRPDLIDPIWEYHHDVGKSITGGFVYRGKNFPELEGHYLHADYVTGKIWALLYDPAKKRVTANRSIQDKKQPIMSWGEDEKGEAYLMTYSNFGQGIYQLVRSKN